MRCCGGTTTVGPILMFSLVASLAERRRMPVEGAAREGADMVMECVVFGFEEVCNVCLLQGVIQLWFEQV